MAAVRCTSMSESTSRSIRTREEGERYCRPLNRSASPDARMCAWAVRVRALTLSPFAAPPPFASALRELATPPAFLAGAGAGDAGALLPS